MGVALVPKALMVGGGGLLTVTVTEAFTVPEALEAVRV
jgi:hypothetical protein